MPAIQTCNLVVANKVQGLDGRWRSLDSRALHRAVVAMSELYEAFLVDEVARALPVRWGWGSARLAEMSAQLELIRRAVDPSDRIERGV